MLWPNQLWMGLLWSNFMVKNNKKVLIKYVHQQLISTRTHGHSQIANTAKVTYILDDSDVILSNIVVATMLEAYYFAAV